VPGEVREQRPAQVVACWQAAGAQRGVQDRRPHLVGAVVIADALDPQFTAAQWHSRGESGLGPGRRSTGRMVVPDDVGNRVVEQHGARHAQTVALARGDRGARE